LVGRLVNFKPLKSLLYISSLPENSQTGGANAVNYHTFKQLQKHFKCTYVQINPKESTVAKWKSQFMRKILKRPGRFNFYSRKRLILIAKEFEALKGEFDFVFFRGFTPWVLCKPNVPYLAYNDVHFLQFFQNTFNFSQFLKSDVQRICAQEQSWLSDSELAFFESKWGATQCSRDYRIDISKLIALGRGGNIPIPLTDEYLGDLNLLIIANNFYQKGGDLVYEAFKKLKSIHENLKLHIIGGDPGTEVKNENGVFYHGYLYKENNNDMKSLVKILSEAFLLVHVTREDTNPLVITEAAYFGCPSISLRKFAIPELIVHNKTGILLPSKANPIDIANAIDSCIINKLEYRAMRKSTKLYNDKMFSWTTIGLEVKNKINQLQFN